MKFLFTDILPIGVPEGGESFSSAVAAEIETADRVEIAVGYVSKASLLELDALIRNANVKYTVLTIGIPNKYYSDLNQLL